MDFLSLFVLIPALTVIMIITCKNHMQVKWTAAVGMGIQLLLSIGLVFRYFKERAEGNSEEMLFSSSAVWFEPFNIQYAVGVDGISVVMLLLTSVVIFTGVFASWGVTDMAKEFFVSLLVLVTGVFGFFISLDLFTMFFFYEIAVIPMYLLIGIWGSGPKEYSAMKLTLMLMAGSALLLVGLLGIYFNSNAGGGELTFHILEIAKVNIPIEAQRLFFPLVFVGFGVLGALFPFHTWSPDGHASAPTAVSMLHAGVLMKLGGYGCLRIAMFLLPDAANEMAWIFIILTSISVIYGALGAVMMKDLKYINAYSSVSHCGLVLFAVLMANQTAMNGAVLQMLSHGLMCALFFALIGMIYGRTHTRNINEMGGLLKVMPFLSVAYVIGGLASLGLPGLSGFAAEMTIFVGAWQEPGTFTRITTIIACASIVVTAVYILRALAIMLFGPIRDKHHEHVVPAQWHEKISAGLLLLAIIGMGIAPFWLSDIISESLPPIVERFIHIDVISMIQTP